MSDSTASTEAKRASTEAKRHPAPRTEEELLEREERRARAELRDTSRELGEDILEAVDLRHHAARHPFTVLAASLSAGFLLGRPLLNILKSPRHGRALLGSLPRIATRLASFSALGKALTALGPSKDGDR